MVDIGFLFQAKLCSIHQQMRREFQELQRFLTLSEPDSEDTEEAEEC